MKAGWKLKNYTQRKIVNNISMKRPLRKASWASEIYHGYFCERERNGRSHSSHPMIKWQAFWMFSFAWMFYFLCKLGGVQSAPKIKSLLSAFQYTPLVEEKNWATADKRIQNNFKYTFENDHELEHHQIWILGRKLFEKHWSSWLLTEPSSVLTQQVSHLYMFLKHQLGS